MTEAALSTSQPQLSSILSSYKSLDLPSLQSHLTQLVTPLTSLQTSSLQSRKKLAEETRSWKKLDTDAAKIDGFKPLLKLYQGEVDELTKRAREAEGGVTRVEERLRGIEDPANVVEKLIDQFANHPDLAALRSQVASLRTENASLQSRLTSLPQLEEERSRLTSRVLSLDHRLEEQRSAVEAETAARFSERLDNAKAREVELEKQLEGLRASHEAAQKRLLASATDYVAAAAAPSGGASAAEVEMLSADLQRAQQRVAAVERRNEQLREEVEKVKAGDADDKRVADLERRLSEEQEGRARLQAELDGAAEKERASLASAEEGLGQVRRTLKERNDELATLRQKLDSMADYGEIKRELEIMRLVEFSSGLDEEEDDNSAVRSKAKPLEALLMEKNKKLQDDLATLRVKHHELEQGSATSTSEVPNLREEVKRLTALNERLEADLMAVGGASESKSAAAPQKPAGSKTQSAEEMLEEMGRIEKGELDFKAGKAAQPQANGSTAATTSASSSAPARNVVSTSTPASSSSSESVLPIIVSQRDRFRARNAELEEELRKQFDVVTQLRSDVKGLQADNLALYEKVRYLQSYGGSGSSAASMVTAVPARTDASGAYPPQRSYQQERGGLIPSSIASGSSTPHPEDKYRRRYEASMNPFEAFRGREQRSALARLNPLERLLHAAATVLVKDRRARIAAVLYAAGMHLLIFFVMVEYTFSGHQVSAAGYHNAMSGGGPAPMEPVPGRQ
ncbi:hypothetical protein BDZ90DRAFT_228251 [Jaminaea rosea]|uniref:Protein CASP n=1 Tax=Jaminaea rosea TaxID=1569628 RepID=A0A316UJN3_9BASI|nr:hypothetical protein BDZ90DRAFT_228251 [Jaminaea rosea]PWN25486.1 hypothetical protein BDZ90DRAFT_228251 [Jaminaea rosea]